MDKTLELFIVFHKILFEKNTEEFTDEERKQWFRWYAVNEAIEKKIPDWIPDGCLVEEYKLREYNPLLQMTNSYQNSTFFHLFRNQEMLKGKYIGFAQYDMEIKAEGLRNAMRLMEERNDMCFMMYVFSFPYLFTQFAPSDFEEFVVKPYNEFYGTKHKIEETALVPLPLLHTFIIPKWFFLHMMRFIEKNNTNVLRMLKFDTRHYAGTMERIFAICIGFAILEAKFSDVMHVSGFLNNESQRTQDAVRGVEAGSEVKD
jgi:hypothetical protein